MRLSISSSNPSILQSCVVALTLFALMSCITEYGARKLGFRPSVADNQFYWSHTFQRLLRVPHRKCIVIVGASRAHQGIDPAVLSNELGIPAYQLAIDNTPSWAIVQRLAKETSFSGTIFYEVHESGLLSVHRNSGSIMLDYYDNVYNNWSFIDRKLNARTKSYLQERSVLFSNLDPWSLLLRRTMPLPTMRPDRQYILGYEGYPRYTSIVRKNREEAARKHTLSDHNTRRKEFLNEALPRIRRTNEQLRRHGGQLILFRIVTSGRYRQYDQEAYPRPDYWDRITPATGVLTIHFSDYEGLRNISCPEGSHIDSKDAPAYTKQLAHALKNKLQ